MRIVLTLAAGVLLGGLGLGAVSASAAPAMPASDVVAGNTVDTVRHHGRHHHWHRSHRSVLGHHHSTKAERHRRRMNTYRHGNPNARNPERPGYKQQLGNTTGGPRY